MAKNVKKQYAVIGLGRFGTALTKGLEREGAEVLVIDNDPDRINEIDNYCTQAICADATDEKVLEKLGVRNLDVAVVCIADDIESSIFVTLTLKQLGVPKVIAKAQSDKHRSVLQKIGADLVILPEEEAANKLVEKLLKPNIVEILSLSDDFRIVEIKTPVKWQNKTLLQLDLRNTERVSILLIKRGNDVITTPDRETVLMPDDILLISGDATATKRLSAKATASVIDDD